jgi:hypothetical protein
VIGDAYDHCRFCSELVTGQSRSGLRGKSGFGPQTSALRHPPARWESSPPELIESRLRDHRRRRARIIDYLAERQEFPLTIKHVFTKSIVWRREIRRSVFQVSSFDRQGIQKLLLFWGFSSILLTKARSDFFVGDARWEKGDSASLF